MYILVIVPLRAPPVLEEKVLRVLLTLAIAEATLRLSVSYQVLLGEIHFQVLAYVAADLRLRTPRAAVLLLSYSCKRIELIMFIYL